MKQDAQDLTLVKILQCTDLKDQDVLEIGCGDGRITQYVAGAAKTLVAVDPDAQSLDKARVLVPNADFRTGVGENLEFDNDSFDVVLFTHSLHHQDSYRALQEAHRVVKRSGRVVVLEPVAEGDIHQLFTLLLDETERMDQARRAVTNSAFELKHLEIFETEWVFDNKEELYKYLGDYYGGAVDQGVITQVNEILGDKRASSPIRLTDKVLLVSLQKRYF
jgi:ubiquinone/menaquinone biosynthesis C-methylase UbiE